mmetsp:Transcript_19650/g.32030  ORF Transcript_19650/g.32030 Transcript_19650/m.32030 type:complete len:710 (+) Transcript_19650:154-2283(+)
MSRRLNKHKAPPYDFSEVPGCTKDLQESCVVRIYSRPQWFSCIGELVQICTEAVRRQKLRNRFTGKHKDTTKPLSLFYIADRLDTDDPIRGYMVRHKTTGWLQGFIITTTFTTWQRWFKWDSITPNAGIMDRKGSVRPCNANRKVDADGSIAKALNDQFHHGDVKAEGIMWPRIAEISLLGALGCGGWLVKLALEEMELNNEYDWVVLQALDNSICFYEKMGFIRVGAIAKYYQESPASEEWPKGKIGKPKTQTVNTPNPKAGRTLGYRHWTWDDEGIKRLPEPSYMMALKLKRRIRQPVHPAKNEGGGSKDAKDCGGGAGTTKAKAATPLPKGRAKASDILTRKKRPATERKPPKKASSSSSSMNNNNASAPHPCIFTDRLQELLVKRAPHIKVTKRREKKRESSDDEADTAVKRRQSIDALSAVAEDDDIKEEVLWAWEGAVPQSVIDSHKKKNKSRGGSAKKKKNGKRTPKRKRGRNGDGSWSEDAYDDDDDDDDMASSDAGGQRGDNGSEYHDDSAHDDDDDDNAAVRGKRRNMVYSTPIRGMRSIRARRRSGSGRSVLKRRRATDQNGPRRVKVKWHLDVTFRYKKSRTCKDKTLRATRVTHIVRYPDGYHHPIDGLSSSSNSRSLLNKTLASLLAAPNGQQHQAMQNGGGGGGGGYGCCWRGPIGRGGSSLNSNRYISRYGRNEKRRRRRRRSDKQRRHYRYT